MFGFLKNVFKKPPEAPAHSPEAVAPPSVPAPGPAHAYTGASTARASVRRPVTQQPAAKGVEIPLQKILDGLPLELQPRVREPNVGELSLTIPLEKVLAQLSRGAVKISFGELRQAVPEVFTAETDRDRVLVPLPLADILAQLNPALIARRRVQRQVEVPSDIGSPFEVGPQGVVFPTEPETAQPEAELPAEPAEPPPAPAAPALTVRPRFNPAPTSPMPAPAPLPLPARHTLSGTTPPVAPAASLPALEVPEEPIPFVPPITMAKPPVAPAAPKSPMRQNNGHGQLPPAPVSLAPVSPAPVSPAPVKPAPVKPAPVKPAPVKPAEPPAGQSGPLVVNLTALAEGWPEAVRREIVDLRLVDAKVALPATQIEQALRQGRIAFSWKTLRSWIQPAVLPTVSAHDGTVLELPLKVVAPMYLARQRETAKAQPKVTVDEDIPNLFFGFPQPEGTPSSGSAPRPTDTNYYVWDDAADMVKVHESETKRGPSPGTKFVAKYATPNEVVSRAAGLEGVAGALIALPDGLMVASRLAPDLNADTLAAFLPQIFGKVSQCTKELRMGELNNLNFTVGNVPWKIFRVNAIFFAAFGSAGEPLPTAQLAALAAELDHKPK